MGVTWLTLAENPVESLRNDGGKLEEKGFELLPGVVDRRYQPTR